VNKKKALEVLKQEWHGCTRCELHAERKKDHIIFGQGPHEVDILFVGGPPTEDDLIYNYYPEGDRGALLRQTLKVAGIDHKACFFAPLLGCRPTVLIPETEDAPARIQNRQPQKEEIEACAPRLMRLIYVLDPRLIVAMGLEAWSLLVSNKDKPQNVKTIAKAHTDLFIARVPGVVQDVTYPVLALVSPHTFVANPSVAPHGPLSTSAVALKQAADYVSWIKRNERKDAAQ
jgi:uracil-DNA glycosylase family 4